MARVRRCVQLRPAICRHLNRQRTSLRGNPPFPISDAEVVNAKAVFEHLPLMEDGAFGVDLQAGGPKSVVEGNLTRGEFVHSLIITRATNPVFTVLYLQLRDIPVGWGRVNQISLRYAVFGGNIVILG